MLRHLTAAFLCALAFFGGCLVAFGEDHLVINQSNGGIAMTVDYGYGQRAQYYEGASAVSIRTNKVCTGLQYARTRDVDYNARAAGAIAQMRAIAPPIVVNPCPQPCYTRGYCGAIVPTCATGYCGRTPCSCGRCGAADPRNAMVVYPAGDPRAVCNCAANRNGVGAPCACPPTCSQCNPGRVIAVVR